MYFVYGHRFCVKAANLVHLTRILLTDADVLLKSNRQVTRKICTEAFHGAHDDQTLTVKTNEDVGNEDVEVPEVNASRLHTISNSSVQVVMVRNR